MGKGGELANKPLNFKLSNLTDESLRKWAKAYGIKAAETGKREFLLEILVYLL